MSAPVLDSFAQSLYDSVAPLAYDDALHSYALANYCAAIGGMFQIVDDYGRDQVVGGEVLPGWSQLLDINRCPPEALGWLGQFVGVPLLAGLSDSAQRARILGVGGFNRGTLASFTAAAQQWLTGTKTVIIRERDAGACPQLPAYGITVVTRSSETPSADLPVNNVVTNSQFETDATGWDTYSPTLPLPTLSRDAVTPPNSAFSGACLLCTAVNSTGSAVDKFFWDTLGTPNFHTYAPGDQIYCRGAVYGDSGWRMGVRANDGPNAGAFFNSVDNPGNFIFPDASYHDLITGAPGEVTEFIFIVPTGTTQINIGWKNNVPATTTRNLRVDNVLMTRAPKRTNFVTGVKLAGGGPVEAALRSQKPGGLVLLFSVLDGEDYQTLLTNHALYSNVFSDFLTYQGVATGTPGT